MTAAQLLRVALLLIAATWAAACAQTTLPGLLSPSLVNQADKLGRQTAIAAFAHDDAALLRLGLDQQTIDTESKPLPPAATESKLQFLGDGIVGDEYFRQYQTTHSPKTQIRVWFTRYGGDLQVHSFQCLPSATDQSH